MPPADLTRRSLPIVETEQPWFRIHRAEHQALFFGRSGDYRFDPPAHEYGVLYVGEDEHCAFVETFGHNTGIRVISLAELRARTLSRIEPRRPLRLVDLTGSGLARLGGDGRLCTGDYRVSQYWARAFSRHPESPDGLRYRSRHDPSRLCGALYDRAAEALIATRLGSLADARHAPLLASVLDTYGFGLVDDAT